MTPPGADTNPVTHRVLDPSVRDVLAISDAQEDVFTTFLVEIVVLATWHDPVESPCQVVNAREILSHRLV